MSEVKPCRHRNSRLCVLEGCHGEACINGTGGLMKAGLGVGHIWTAVSCPAYRTLDGADCTCGGGAS